MTLSRCWFGKGPTAAAGPFACRLQPREIWILGVLVTACPVTDMMGAVVSRVSRWSFNEV